MSYLAHFEDHPAVLHLKRAHGETHRAYLATHASIILAETSRFVDDLGNPMGAMWLINTTDRALALKLCHADPYWTHGVRKDVALVAWVPGPYDLRAAHC